MSLSCLVSSSCFVFYYCFVLFCLVLSFLPFSLCTGFTCLVFSCLVSPHVLSCLALSGLAWSSLVWSGLFWAGLALTLRPSHACHDEHICKGRRIPRSGLLWEYQVLCWILVSTERPGRGLAFVLFWSWAVCFCFRNKHGCWPQETPILIGTQQLLSISLPPSLWIDTILFENGTPYLWLFTNSSGHVMRKNADKLRWALVS